jgi:hypothetical protein
VELVPVVLVVLVVLVELETPVNLEILVVAVPVVVEEEEQQILHFLVLPIREPQASPARVASVGAAAQEILLKLVRHKLVATVEMDLMEIPEVPALQVEDNLELKQVLVVLVPLEVGVHLLQL